MSIQDDNKRIVARFDAILNNRDLSLLDVLCAPDMVNHSLAPGRPAGLEGTRDYLATGGRSWQTEHWRQSYVVAEDDLVVQFGVRAGHWPGGDFFGYPMQSGDFTREVAFMYRVTDGRIAERWAVRDDLGLLHRLGALPARSG
jgi:ketosteroid isomerase-like protein